MCFVSPSISAVFLGLSLVIPFSLHRRCLQKRSYVPSPLASPLVTRRLKKRFDGPIGKNHKKKSPKIKETNKVSENPSCFDAVEGLPTFSTASDLDHDKLRGPIKKRTLCMNNPSQNFSKENPCRKEKISFLSSICTSIFGSSGMNSSGSSYIKSVPSLKGKWGGPTSCKRDLWTKKNQFVEEVVEGNISSGELELQSHWFDDVGRIANRHQEDCWDVW